MRQSNPKLELVTVEPWFVRGILNNMLYTFRLLTFINDIVSFDLASWMGEGLLMEPTLDGSQREKNTG